MRCIHCGDDVTIRHEREGLIHKKSALYGCRVVKSEKGTHPTVAEVQDAAAEERLRIALSVRVPETTE